MDQCQSSYNLIEPYMAATKPRYTRNKGGTDNHDEQKLSKTSTREEIFEHIAVHIDELNKGTSVSVVFDDKTEDGITLTHIDLCRKRRGADGGGVQLFQLRRASLAQTARPGDDFGAVGGAVGGGDGAAERENQGEIGVLAGNQGCSAGATAWAGGGMPAGEAGDVLRARGGGKRAKKALGAAESDRPRLARTENRSVTPHFLEGARTVRSALVKTW